MALVPDAEPRPPGLCCCPTLKLYACSSLDCTIRIWTAENRLLRWAVAGRAGGAGSLVGWEPGLSYLCPHQNSLAGKGREGLAPAAASVFYSVEQGWTLALDTPPGSCS